jgi:hypothetical protein
MQLWKACSDGEYILPRNRGNWSTNSEVFILLCPARYAVGCYHFLVLIPSILCIGVLRAKNIAHLSRNHPRRKESHNGIDVKSESDSEARLESDLFDGEPALFLKDVEAVLVKSDPDVIPSGIGSSGKRQRGMQDASRNSEAYVGSTSTSISTRKRQRRKSDEGVFRLRDSEVIDLTSD